MKYRRCSCIVQESKLKASRTSRLHRTREQAYEASLAASPKNCRRLPKQRKSNWISCGSQSTRDSMKVLRNKDLAVFSDCLADREKVKSLPRDFFLLFFCLTHSCLSILNRSRKTTSSRVSTDDGACPKWIIQLYLLVRFLYCHSKLVLFDCDGLDLSHS